MQRAASPWLVAASPAARPLVLYCFSYAGGSAASYLPWQADLHGEIEIVAVELPGRGRRFHEAPLTCIDTAVAGVARAIAERGRAPFAFFGHSLGALLAFESARWLQRQGLAQPCHLIVSGAGAPQLRGAPRELHLLDDAALTAELEQYNGTPPEVLANRELMELVLPVIRADFAMGAAYRYQSGPKLAMPITVLAGRDDIHVDEARAQGWQRESSGACEVALFDGDHFFLHPQRAAVLARIRRALLPATHP